MSIISIEHVGKKYLLRHTKQYRYVALRDVIAEKFRHAGTKIIHPFRASARPDTTREEFWALKDVSFEVEQGDRVGIIGRNGAGKSTLLKVLSRITEPTTGKISLKGRVASLLEVGTGFHPELTGRENIFLNGAILGMSRTEIRKKFDEIVAFAEVEKFLDTPVKRYSSGMYVRLAFAVAAHLEPEILVIDEVLAVGDAHFQQKCLGKMQEVSHKEGRTILFVSHNMSMVQSFCNKGVLLEQGNLSQYRSTETVIRAYLEKTYSSDSNAQLLENRTDRTGSGKVRASRFRVLNEEGKEEHALQSGRTYLFAIDYINHTGEKLDDVVVSLDIHDERDIRVLLFRTNFTRSNISLNSDRGCITCKVQNLPLANGSYRFTIFMSHADAEELDYIENVLPISVEGGDFFGTGSHGLPSHCKILHKTDWSSV